MIRARAGWLARSAAQATWWLLGELVVLAVVSTFAAVVGWNVLWTGWPPLWYWLFALKFVAPARVAYLVGAALRRRWSEPPAVTRAEITATHPDVEVGGRE